ncbi:GNAT family N-acetyltransferase [Streptomyces sp. NPDC048720]|uniref:GNAT family N-acetyltransferase n=1 Tax=unclassified Streptomyces TaxID=2593676 RepID=UPI00371ABC3D
MRLRGYREADRTLLTGDWLPGEMLGLPVAGRPPLAEPSVVAAPADDTSEVCVVPGAGYVRFAEIDWIHRRARLETGLHTVPEDPARLLAAAVDHGFRVLGLHRLHGLVTPAAHPPDAALAAAGFRHEATIPQALWLAGRPVERQVWGVVDA